MPMGIKSEYNKAATIFASIFSNMLLLSFASLTCFMKGKCFQQSLKIGIFNVYIILLRNGAHHALLLLPDE